MTEHPFNLVLVAGAMRSGTSLLQHVLCSSPDANPFVHGCRYLTSQIAIFAQYSGKDELYIKDYLGEPKDFFDFSKGIIDRLLAATHSQLGQPKHMVLKSPELSSYFPHAAALLPQARFVISVRDPKDTIASMIAVGEKHRQEGVSSFLAGANRNIPQLCASYRQFYAPVLKALGSDRGGLRNRVCFSTYESLIDDTEKAVDRLSRFCGIPLTPGSVNPETTWRSKIDPEKDALFSDPHWSAYVTELSGGPISGSSIGRYRDVLSEAEAKKTDLLCADLRRAFGYEAI